MVNRNSYRCKNVHGRTPYVAAPTTAVNVYSPGVYHGVTCLKSTRPLMKAAAHVSGVVYFHCVPKYAQSVVLREVFAMMYG